MTEYVRTVRAHEGETVEIQWRCHDGSIHIERYTVPPKTVRAARDDDVRRRVEAAPSDLVSWGDTREKT